MPTFFGANMFHGLTIDLSGLSQGDLIFAAAINDDGELTGPSGWTQVGSTLGPGGDFDSHANLWMVVHGASTPNETFTGTAADAAIYVIVYRSAAPTLVDSATGTLENGVAPSVTADAAGQTLLCFYSDSSWSTDTAVPPGMTDRTVTTSGGGMPWLAAEEALSSAGGTGTRTFDATDPVGTWSLILAPDEVTGTAHGELGGLTASATGRVSTLGTAHGALGGLTAHMRSTVMGDLAALLGGLTASATGEPFTTGVGVAALGGLAAQAQGHNLPARPRWRLRSPTYHENLWTSDRFLIRYTLPRGITLAVVGTNVVELIYPHQGDFEEYDVVYPGGYDHLLTTPEANVLVAAGYGDHIERLKG